MLKIVTDGGVDMPVGWEKKYKIDIIPLMVRFGEEVYTAGVNLNGNKFYQLVKEKNIIPKSSLPSPFQMMEFYRKIANAKDRILSLHISGKISGTFSSVVQAAKELSGELNIYPFDSGAGSAALGFMCREARLLDRAGLSVQEILNKLENIKSRLTVIFTVDNLEFARLNGRVNALQSAVSSMLNIKPIIILRDGLLQMGDKVRTRSKSIERILETVRARVGTKKVNLAIVHANDLIAAKALMEKAKNLFNIKELVLSDLSIPVAANLGPGTVGIVAIPVEEE
jgi:DegV family protein with EDD domain